MFPTLDRAFLRTTKEDSKKTYPRKRPKNFVGTHCGGKNLHGIKHHLGKIYQKTSHRIYDSQECGVFLMQKIIVFISIFLAQGNLSGFESFFPLDFVLYLNQHTVGYAPQLQCIAGEKSKMIQPSLPPIPFEACAEALCGNPKENTNGFDMFSEIDPGPRIEEAYNQIFDKAVGLYRMKVDYTLDSLKKLKAFIENGDDLAIEGPFKFLAALRLSLVELFLDIAKTIGADHENFKVIFSFKENSDITHSLPVYINPDIAGPLIGATKEMINSNEMKTALYVGFTGGGVRVILGQHPDKSLKEALTEEINKITPLSRVLTERFKSIGFFSSNFFNKDIIDETLQADHPSESMIDELFVTIMMIKMFHRMIVNQQGIASFKALERDSYRDYYHIPAISEKINSMIADLNSLSAQLTSLRKDQIVTTPIGQDIAHCASILSIGRNALPTKRENDNFNTIAEGVRKRVIDRFVPLFSKQTSQRLRPFVQRIHFAYPDNKNQFNFLINKNLDSEYNEIQRDFDKYKSNVQNERSKNQILARIQDIGDWSIEDFTGTLRDNVCDDYEIKEFEELQDALYEGQVGVLVISWQSVKNPRMGEGVLAHEIGHAIGNYFENNATSIQSLRRYRDTRLCLASMQPVRSSNEQEVRQYIGNSEEPQEITYQVSQYTEEDWGDLVSGAVMPTDSPNMACFLLDQEDDKYIMLNPFRTEQEERDLEKWRREDDKEGPLKHSPSMFRALHMEFLKNRDLPSSCKQALEAQLMDIFPKNCLPSSSLR